MSTYCACLTQEGIRCKRVVKEGENFCTQHKKKCLTQVPQGRELRQKLERQRRQKQQIQETSVPVQPEVTEPPEWDFDHLHPIPEVLRDFPYVYVSGSHPDDIRRYWILPSTWKMRVKMWIAPKIRTMTLGEVTTMDPTTYAKCEIEPVDVIDSKVNRILPVVPENMKHEILNGGIFNIKNPGSLIPPQIRRNGKIQEQLPALSYEENEQLITDPTIATPNQLLIQMRRLAHHLVMTKLAQQAHQKQEAERSARQIRQKQEAEKKKPRAAPQVVSPRVVPRVVVPQAAAKSCAKQTQKKYLERPSPPFPANECCGQVMQGNDGRMYISVADVRGICRWKIDK